MFIKENIYRLIIIFLILAFAAGLFLSVKFFKSNIEISTNPSSSVLKSSTVKFDIDTYQKVLKRLGILSNSEI